MTKQNQGFTLLELLITIAIVGILSTVAFSFYGDNVRATNRTEARSELSRTAGSLEKCRSLYGTYNSANCATVGALPISTVSSYYSITAVLNPTTFVLTATPIAGSRQASDAYCTTLTLSNTGLRQATGSETTKCW